MSTVHRHDLVSFGAFEVDIHSGEIRKGGMRVRLQEQPFRVLVALLSKPGEVITREELQLQIWGEHTTVDFDRGIASAMNRLREALGDSAEHPRYIETLAKRGYRFIAPVTTETLKTAPESAAPSQIVAQTAPSATERAVPSMQEVAPVVVASQAPSPAIERHLPKRLRIFRPATIAWVCVGVVAIGGLIALAIFNMGHPTAPVRPPRVVQLTQSSEIYDGPPNPENLLTLTTDGPRIYTSFLVDGRAEIGSIDLNGTQMQPVSLPPDLNSSSIADISRDGSRLIVRGRRSRDSEQPLWIIPTVGSSALRVGDVLAHDATFMPADGGILYAAGNELGVARLDTGSVSSYASLPGRAFWLRWSPDGRVLRFTLIDPLTHRSSLWELDAASRHSHPLNLRELVGLSACCGSWTDDGSLYVFRADSAGGSDIWSAGTGSNPQVNQLTNGPLRFTSPLPSRTEKTVFAVGLEPPGATRLYDQKLHQFVAAPEFLARARRVTYSRDGKWVAWIDVNGRLWRASSAEGSNRVRLTPDDLDTFLAQWSPDGSQLVLMARKPGETWQIYTVPSAGGAVNLVLADPRNLADPDWTADGSHLVFGREADLMGKESGPHNLQILDLKSLKTEVLPGSTDLFSPRCSPDGRSIVALSLDQTRLMLFDIQSRSWRLLFSGGAADPVWSPDSKMVYFHAFADPHSAILRVPVAGGVAQPVADVSSLGSTTVDEYFFGGITPAGAPIVEPRISVGNLFSITLPR